MENNTSTLQEKIGKLFYAGIECSLYFKNKHNEEAKYIFAKTLDMVAQLFDDQQHNPLLDDINGIYGVDEMCELKITFEGGSKVVNLSLFELQFDYFNLLMDNLMIRIVDCEETRKLLIDTLSSAKLFNYLILNEDGRPDIVENTIGIFLELFHLSDKELFRDTIISYLVELDEIPSFDENYGLLKITPKQVVDFVYFIEYLDISGKIEEFLRME